MEAVRAGTRRVCWGLGLWIVDIDLYGLTPSKSCESSLYTQRLVRLQEFYTKPDYLSCLPRQVCTDLLEPSFMESRCEIGPSFIWPNNDNAAFESLLLNSNKSRVNYSPDISPQVWPELHGISCHVLLTLNV